MWCCFSSFVCADDIEVCRHWAPGSLTTDAQTVGFPTGRGVLQTGAAIHGRCLQALLKRVNLQTPPDAEIASNCAFPSVSGISNDFG